jgi:hypothetical protein
MSHRTRLACATFGRPHLSLSNRTSRARSRIVDVPTDTLEETEVKTKLIRRNPMTLYLQQQWHNYGPTAPAAKPTEQPQAKPAQDRAA